MSAENAQLSAHVHLLESELEAAQHHGQHLGGIDSTDVSPRSRQQHFAFQDEQGGDAVHENEQTAGTLNEQDVQQNGSAPEAAEVCESLSAGAHTAPICWVPEHSRAKTCCGCPPCRPMRPTSPSRRIPPMITLPGQVHSLEQQSNAARLCC